MVHGVSMCAFVGLAGRPVKGKEAVLRLRMQVAEQSCNQQLQLN